MLRINADKTICEIRVIRGHRDSGCGLVAPSSLAATVRTIPTQFVPFHTVVGMRGALTPGILSGSPIRVGRNVFFQLALMGTAYYILNMTLHGIEISRERIAAFCRANGIRRLALFGSVLRDDFRPESDVDVLVEFQPGVHVGLAFIRMQDELSTILGRKVDLNTRGTLSKYFREEVLHAAESVYVAA